MTVFELDERIDLVQKDLFYEYAYAFRFWNKLLILMKQPRSKTKIKGLILTGEPDSGKSTLFRQFQHEYTSNIKDAREQDVMIFNVPQGVGAVQVFAELCRKLGIPDIPANPRSYPITYFVEKASLKLNQDVKLLIVDEFQNLYELQPSLRKRVISAFNQLINESRIPIVLVGVTGVTEILTNIDNDLSNLKGTFSSRFSKYQMKHWKDDDEFRGILISIYDDLHLKPDPQTLPFYQDDAIREKILEYSQGLLGKIITLLKETAIKIFTTKLPEKITLDLLKETAIELEYYIDNEFKEND